MPPDPPTCRALRARITSPSAPPPLRTLDPPLTDNWTHMKHHNLTRKNTMGFINGISPFNSSLITIWPIYLASFANLSPSTRMLKSNIITCAVWIGNCKPPMNILLTSLKTLRDRLRSLGLRVTTSEGVKTFFFWPLFGVFDMIAKAPLLNMNSEYGCPTRLDHGKILGYTYQDKTTHSEHNQQWLTSHETCLGIKGPSILCLLEIWCPCRLHALRSWGSY